MSALNTSGKETLEDFHHKPKKIRLFTDPSYGGVGDVDDHTAILMCCHYLQQNVINSLEIVISSKLDTERLQYLKGLPFYKGLLNSSLLPEGKFTIETLTEFAGNLIVTDNGDSKVVSTNKDASFNVLNIWNAPLGKTNDKVLDYFGQVGVNYLIQGYDPKNDANLKETREYTGLNDAQIKEKLKLGEGAEIPGINSQASNKTFLYEKIPEFNLSEPNQLIDDLKRLYYLKTIGQAVCLSKSVLENHSTGFFAPNLTYMSGYDSDQRKNEGNHERTKELIFGTGIQNKVYWGGGKGNNVKPFFFALSSMSDPDQTMRDILSITDKDNLNNEVIKISNELVLDTGKIFPSTLNISEPSKRGFRFIVLSLCWVFGTNNMVDFFDTEHVEENTYNIVGLKGFSLSESMERHIEVLNEQILKFLDSKSLDTDVATIDKKKFLKGVLMSTPPLWDAIAVIKYLKFPNEEEVSDQDYINEIRSALQNVLVGSEAKKPTYAQVLKKGINGGKRTNKKLRKNKKLSLRKMKGGSKKANQKKLKPRKSRKA